MNLLFHLSTICVNRWRSPSEKCGIISGDSLWAQHPAIAHFGLGDLKTVELLEINWGNGKATRIEKPKVNQYHLAQPE